MDIFWNHTMHELSFLFFSSSSTEISIFLLLNLVGWNEDQRLN